MDILNWLHWKKAGRIVSSVSDNALIAVGEPDPKRDDKYLTVAIKKADLLPTIPRFPNYADNTLATAAIPDGVPLPGMIYFNTTTDQLKVYNGSVWQTV
jgi:hypothetical protein